MDFFKTPAIIAAIITGSIAAIGTIIQWLIAYTKNNFETKTTFDKTLKEKLENIYSPLIMQISKSSNKRNFVEGEVISLINRYGYLLSSELLSDLRELYRLESNRPNGDIDDYIAEYQNLRAKIDKQANKDFIELQSLYNNSFYNYKFKYSSQWYIKVYLFVIKSCLFITGVFWFVFFSLYFLSQIKPVEVLTNNPIVNLVSTILIIIIGLTTTLGGMALITKIVIFINDWINKKRKTFKPFEYVPQTGIYKCEVCNEIRKFHKNEQFEECTSKKLFHIFKSILYGNIWTINTEIIEISEKNDLKISG